MELNQLIAQRLTERKLKESRDKSISRDSINRASEEYEWIKPLDTQKLTEEKLKESVGKSEILFKLRKLRTEATEALYKYEQLGNLREARDILYYLVRDSKYALDMLEREVNDGSSSTREAKGIRDSEELTIDDDPEETPQEFDSKDTSINSGKIPALFGMVKFKEGSINLDWGGGKFDNVNEFLQEKFGATNLVYDKYNRDASHNSEVLAQVRKNEGADTVTCSNVLNVIKEESERLACLRNCKRYLKSGGTCYITVYEGNRSGVGKITKDTDGTKSYQLNRKTQDYESEIQQVFPGAIRKGKLFICK